MKQKKITNARHYKQPQNPRVRLVVTIGSVFPALVIAPVMEGQHKQRFNVEKIVY